MKQIFIFLLLCVAGISFSSCSDEFLAENKKQIDGYELDVPLYIEPTSVFTEVSVKLPDLKNKSFRVIQYPQFIHFDSFHGKIDDDGTLSLNLKVDEFQSPVSSEPQILGHIILNVDDFGLLQVNVLHLNYGVPQVSSPTETIDFDIDYRPSIFELKNLGEGILFYKLVKLPSWIDLKYIHLSDAPVLNKVNLLRQFENQFFSVTPLVDNLTAGTHEDEIVFETSDVQRPVLTIKVKIRVREYKNPDSMIPIDGTVVDAAFDKITNTLLLITKNPSKLISFQVATGQKKEKNLPQVAYRVNLSSDNKTVLLGESGNVEFVDLPSLDTKANVGVDFIVTDVVDGENGCYYFASKEMEVFSYNPESKSIKKQIDEENGSWNKIQGERMIKVKGKPQLALTRQSVSPNGFYLVDVSDPENMKFKKYWHESFGSQLVTSEDQKYLFSFGNNVYHFPNETNENINSMGELHSQYNSGYIRFDWMHHSAAAGAIWASHEYYDQPGYAYKTLITQFDDVTFDEQKSYFLNDYVATIHNKKDYYTTRAPFFFATANGSKLVLVKNTREDSGNWHLEVIEVTK